jgi:hypothetical protein
MGGKNADLSVEESAVGLIEAIDALTLADTGRFIDYRGRDVPW